VDISPFEDKGSVLTGTTDCHRLWTDFDYKDYRRQNMQTKETKDKGEKATSTAFGSAPMGHGMFELTNKCCAGQDGFSDCSTMMNGMMEKMSNQPCCTPKEDTHAERRNS
jgi:hypothetical protein